MTLDKKYIFIIEELEVGYVMGSYDTKKEAQAKAKALWDEMYQDHELPYLERNPPLFKYKIHVSGLSFYPESLETRTTGLCTTLIYKNNFSIEEFMFLREHTVYAISLDDYKDDDQITDATKIIAN